MQKNNDSDMWFFSFFLSCFVSAVGIFTLLVILKIDKPVQNAINTSSSVKIQKCVPCWYTEEHLCCDKKNIRKWRKLRKKLIDSQKFL